MKFSTVLFFVALCLAGAGVAQTPRPVAAAEPAASTTETEPLATTDDVRVAGELTVITSDRLTYDGGRGLAVFEGNVVVSDPSLKLKSDKLTVFFAERSEVKRMLAEGRVVISSEDRRGWAKRASYDVASGQVVLEGEPRVMRGKDMLIGDRITFWRDENRVLVESEKNRTPTIEQPGARLIIYPEKGRSPLNPTGGNRGQR